MAQLKSNSVQIILDIFAERLSIPGVRLESCISQTSTNVMIRMYAPVSLVLDDGSDRMIVLNYEQQLTQHQMMTAQNPERLIEAIARNLEQALLGEFDRIKTSKVLTFRDTGETITFKDAFWHREKRKHEHQLRPAEKLKVSPKPKRAAWHPYGTQENS